MKKRQSRIVGGALAFLATLLLAGSLAGCTYYRTTEQEAPRQAPSTIVVPQATGPRAMVVPKPAGPDEDTVVVAPDSTVTVTPRPNR